MQRSPRMLLLAAALALSAHSSLAQQAGKPKADPVPPAPAADPVRAAQPADAQPPAGGAVQGDYDFRIVKVYDLSSLAASLTGPEVAPGQAENTLVGAISDSFDVHVSPITRSIFLIGCAAETHERIAELLSQLRASSAERFRVQLVTLTLPNEQVPPIGSALNSASSNVGSRVDHIVQQRSNTMFECSRSETYIADWQPVVGNDSVGYQPLAKTVTSGFNARVYLGSAGSNDVEIRLDGEVTDAKVSITELPLAQGGAKLSIGLPRRDQRTIHAETVVPLGTPVVMSVSSGFEPGQSLVTITKVERLK